MYVEEPNHSLKKVAEEYRTWANGQQKFVPEDSSSDNVEDGNEAYLQKVKTSG